MACGARLEAANTFEHSRAGAAEIPEAAICCGSAGIFNLVQPDAANELGDRKAGLIAPLNADVVATGNPGCVLQMQSALARHGQKIPVVHTIQLVDASIRGEPIEIAAEINPFPQTATRRGCRFSWRCRATPQRQAKSEGRHFAAPFSASRSGSPGKRGPLVPGAGLVARKTRM